VVVGDERSQGGLVGVVVVPDGGGEGEDALEDAGGDAVAGAAAVAFEVELTFEGVVDRFDELAGRFEQPGAGARCPRVRGRLDCFLSESRANRVGKSGWDLLGADMELAGVRLGPTLVALRVGLVSLFEGWTGHKYAEWLAEALVAKERSPVPDAFGEDFDDVAAKLLLDVGRLLVQGTGLDN
jgi:hypothetical protein